MADNPLTYYKLARLLERKRDYQQAISAYAKAISLDPDNIEAHRGIALLYLKRRMPEEAEKHLREVLRLNPKDDEARNSLISFYVKKKRYDETTVTSQGRCRAKSPESGQPISTWGYVRL